MKKTIKSKDMLPFKKIIKIEVKRHKLRFPPLNNKKFF